VNVSVGVGVASGGWGDGDSCTRMPIRVEVLETFPALVPNLLLPPSARVKAFFVAPRVQGVSFSGMIDCDAAVMIEFE